ncbi:hypothetical protein [Acinetobacter baumannii]|uniref:hypothetical protein n=1 Tax=Acinetobacter baumannii TaxID=470 RepID=UPI00287099CA|nr:hypothetical protein [Acinetobacter baumannii]MDR9527448.1 hypothetical protein [Acinetobacter baumannii]
MQQSRLRAKNEYSGYTEKSGIAAQRSVVLTSLNKVPIFKRVKEERIKTFYLKKDINNFIMSLTTNYSSDYPLSHIFNYEGLCCTKI